MTKYEERQDMRTALNSYNVKSKMYNSGGTKCVYVKDEGVLGVVHCAYPDGSVQVEYFVDGIRHYVVLYREEYIEYHKVLAMGTDL